jgi:hypothetical protein
VAQPRPVLDPMEEATTAEVSEVGETQAQAGTQDHTAAPVRYELYVIVQYA